jgi:uncharacterized protein YdhG (YjbR/CyaY superfamily)
MAATDGTAQVETYLAAQPPEQRATLEQLRATLRTILPHAEEGLRYGMPALSLAGKGVAGYGGFKDHCSYFPMSGSVVEAAGDALDGYAVSKGAVNFPVGARLPTGLLRRLVKLRMTEISDVHTGTRTEFFPDGRTKAEGKVKDGELHGAWRWYRKDGSLMRTGRFDRGTESGTWETWDADGNLVRSVRR